MKTCVFFTAHPMANLPDPHSSHNPCPQLCCAPAWHPKTPCPSLPATLGSLGVLPGPAAAHPHHTGASSYEGLQHFLFPRSRFTEYKHKTRHQHSPPTPTSPPRLLPTLSPAPQCCPVPADPNPALTLSPCTPHKHGREFQPSFL